MANKKVLKSKELAKRVKLSKKVKGGLVTSHVELLSSGGGVLNKKVLDAKSKAIDIIEDAKVQAEKIRAEAEAVLKQVNAEMEKAKTRGYEEGKEEGLKSVTEKVIAFEKMREEFYAKAEEDIVKLVMMVAEKVIGKIVHEHGEAIKSIVKQALESALGDRIVVKLSPEDYQIITDSEFEFRDLLDRTKRISFKEDDQVTSGGCVVETEVGTIDARLETQLKAIRKALEL